MIEDNIRQKIESLIARSSLLIALGDSGLDTKNMAKCTCWITEALNIIELAIPSPTNAYRVRIEKTGLLRTISMIAKVTAIAELLRVLLPDIDAGLLGNLSNKIRAETFDDFLDHAEHYRHENRKMEAGVIAGVVFEDTIRRIYRDKITDDKDKNLDILISALSTQNIITGQQSKQARVATHVRTKATHAQWDEFDLAGVEATIQITKLFLREHLGG